MCVAVNLADSVYSTEFLVSLIHLRMNFVCVVLLLLALEEAVVVMQLKDKLSI